MKFCLFLLLAISFSNATFISRRAEPETFCDALPDKKMNCQQVIAKFKSEIKEIESSGECPTDTNLVLYKVFGGVFPANDSTDCNTKNRLCEPGYPKPSKLHECFAAGHQQVGQLVEGDYIYQCVKYTSDKTIPCVEGIRICPDGESSYPIERTILYPKKVVKTEPMTCKDCAIIIPQ